MCQKGGLSKCYPKLMDGIFLIFFLKLHQYIGFKLIQMISWEKSCTVVFGQKLVEDEIFKFCSKLMML